MTALVIALALLTMPTPVAPDAPDAVVSGQATWYDTGPGAGHAAAGTELQTGHWRGRHVQVCRGVRCIDVVIDDTCGCKGSRIIDLAPADFSKLGPLSAGVISVRVNTHVSTPVRSRRVKPRDPVVVVPPPPPTDTVEPVTFLRITGTRMFIQ